MRGQQPFFQFSSSVLVLPSSAPSKFLLESLFRAKRKLAVNKPCIGSHESSPPDAKCRIEDLLNTRWPLLPGTDQTGGLKGELKIVGFRVQRFSSPRSET